MTNHLTPRACAEAIWSEISDEPDDPDASVISIIERHIAARDQSSAGFAAGIAAAVHWHEVTRDAELEKLVSSSDYEPELIETNIEENTYAAYCIGKLSPRASPQSGWPAEGAETTLAQCPIGLFICNGELCLKTEYGNNEGRIDAYIVSSGEFFWGDAPQSIANQRAQIVRPVAYP